MILVISVFSHVLFKCPKLISPSTTKKPVLFRDILTIFDFLGRCVRTLKFSTAKNHPLFPFKKLHCRLLTRFLIRLCLCKMTIQNLKHLHRYQNIRTSKSCLINGRHCFSVQFIALHGKCPYSELFWPVFSRIRTEYGEMLRTCPYSVRMRENKVQNNSEYLHFSFYSVLANLHTTTYKK